MKKIILILLMGILMNPTFHLYGMKITLAGDLQAAKDRAHLARLLMFKTKLVNVNNLDIIQNNLRLNDGTHVHVLSQHGFDSATIYVPPQPVVQVPKPKERIEVRYLLAFEAFDTEDNFKGLVLCRGQGFNTPYEFVEVELTPWGAGYTPFDPEERKLCSFYAGGRLWGDELAWKWFGFETVEDYLTPRVFSYIEYTSGAFADVKTSVELADLGSTGCQNSVVWGATAQASWSVNYSYEEGETVITNEASHDGYFTCYGKRYGSLTQPHSFFIPSAGLNNAEYDPWDNAYPDHNYMHDENASGKQPIAEQATIVYTAGSKDYADLTEIWFDWFGEGEPEIPFCVWFFSTADETNYKAEMDGTHPIEFDRQPEYNTDLASWDYACWTRDLVETKNLASYVWSQDSSAVDADSYVFYAIERTFTMNAYNTGVLNANVWWKSDNKTDGIYPDVSAATPYENEYSNIKSILHCSGDAVDVTEHTKGNPSYYVRYYEAGGKKWHVASCSDGDGIVYLCYTKASDGLKETTPVHLTDGGINPRIEGVTDFDGNPLYNKSRAYRLIRETKVIKEQ